MEKDKSNTDSWSNRDEYTILKQEGKLDDLDRLMKCLHINHGKRGWCKSIPNGTYKFIKGLGPFSIPTGIPVSKGNAVYRDRNSVCWIFVLSIIILAYGYNRFLKIGNPTLLQTRELENYS